MSAALTLLPLTVLALTTTRRRARIVARRTDPAHVPDNAPASVPSRH